MVYAGFTAATAPWLILTVGFLLIVAIYIQVAMLFGVYTPELFPTDVRLRANGICHTFGRAATIGAPLSSSWNRLLQILRSLRRVGVLWPVPAVPRLRSGSLASMPSVGSARWRPFR